LPRPQPSRPHARRWSPSLGAALGLLVGCAPQPPEPEALPEQAQLSLPAPVTPGASGLRAPERASEHAPEPGPEPEPETAPPLSLAASEDPDPPQRAEALVPAPLAHTARHTTRVPRVRTGKPAVKGALDSDRVRRVVRSNLDAVRHCYREGLARNPSLEGRVVIGFVVGAVGEVPVAHVARSTLRGSRGSGVAACIASAVRGWRFPKPPGCGSVLVEQSFVLALGRR
jgi:hypothetical protein